LSENGFCCAGLDHYLVKKDGVKMAGKEEKQLELLFQHISCIQDGFSFHYIQFIGSSPKDVLAPVMKVC